MNRIFGQLNFAETLLQTLVILPYSSAANLFYNLSIKSGTKLNSFGGFFFFALVLALELSVRSLS